MITQEQYQKLKASSELHRQWLKARDYKPYKPEECPIDCRITNEEQSKIEVYEFCANPPARYFLYINEVKRLATTWMGDALGAIIDFGTPYRSNFGDIRQSVKIKGINDKVYFGTYYKSAGDYAKIRIKKS